jgi:hypothetical protein
MAALRCLPDFGIKHITGIKRRKERAHRRLGWIQVAYIVVGRILGLTLVEYLQNSGLCHGRSPRIGEGQGEAGLKIDDVLEPLD